MHKGSIRQHLAEFHKSLCTGDCVACESTLILKNIQKQIGGVNISWLAYLRSTELLYTQWRDKEEIRKQKQRAHLEEQKQKIYQQQIQLQNWKKTLKNKERIIMSQLKKLDCLKRKLVRCKKHYVIKQKTSMKQLNLSKMKPHSCASARTLTTDGTTENNLRKTMYKVIEEGKYEVILPDTADIEHNFDHIILQSKENSCIGQGKTANAYLCKSSLFTCQQTHQVVIKNIREDKKNVKTSSQIHNEAAVMQFLNKNVTVDIFPKYLYIYKDIDGFPNLVMQHCGNLNLLQYRKQYGCFSLAQAKDILCQLHQGILEALKLGIIVKDLSPANTVVYFSSDSISGIKIQIIDLALWRICNKSNRQLNVGPIDLSPITKVINVPENRKCWYNFKKKYSMLHI